MIFLILTILCSSSIALILKFNATRSGHPVVMLTGNYFMASLIGAALILLKQESIFSTEALIFGSVLGVMFIISFFIFAKAVELAGTALATVSSRLSVFIPVLMVVLFFGEVPELKTYIGFLFTAVTIIFFYFSLNDKQSAESQTKKYLYLIAVLLFIGVNDFAIKFFQLLRSGNEEPFFVYMIFTTAFLTGLIVILIKKITVVRSDLLTGFVLGIPNVFSTIFLLAALNSLPAMVVFPVMNIGVIVTTTIAAFILWREKLNKFGLAAVCIGIAAILLLGL